MDVDSQSMCSAWPRAGSGVHEDVLEHVADDQHRQGVRNEEDGSEAVLEGDFGVQQHRQEHAEDVRAERDQNRDENREQIRVADACVLEHRDVVLEADELDNRRNPANW